MQKKSKEVEEKVFMDIDYADDTTILDNTRDDLQESTYLLAQLSLYADPKINARKTHCINDRQGP
jgi:hypothetical protein